MGLNILINKLKQNKFLSDFLTGKAGAQFKRYLITGFTSFGIEYTFYLVLLHFLGQGTAEVLKANTITYVVIFWFNFLMNRLWSFNVRDNLKRQLILYGILFAFNLGATNGLIYFFSHIMGIYPQISKILVMGAVVCWNFILYKKVIYREKK